MIIECPSCQAKYQYDEERFERKPSKKIRCARCKEVFEITNPAFAAARSEPAVVERTQTRREKTRTSTPAPAGEATEPDEPPQERGELALPRGRRLSLALLDGPEAGKVHRIEKPRMTIGRAADISLDDTEASRVHAAIEVRDVTIELHDLGSTNGTLHGGEKIENPVELGDRSEFVVGTTTLMLIITEEQ